MSSIFKFRRGVTAAIAAFTGAQGEVAFDTTKNILVCQDGVTPGGFPLAKLTDITGLAPAAGDAAQTFKVAPATAANQAPQLSQISGKNKIINGNPLINQRAVSGSVVLTAGQYGHDRWKAGAAGCSYAFATVNNITTLTISAGSLQQVIAGRDLQSGTHALSWVGTAQGKIGAGAYSASGVTGAAVGGTNLTVEFNTGTLSSVQMEPGAVSTAFEQRLPAVELSLCRFRYTIGNFVYRWGNNGVTGWVQTLHIPAMAATPTVSWIVSGGSNMTPTGIAAVDNCTIELSGTTTGSGDTVISGTFIASAEL